MATWTDPSTFKHVTGGILSVSDWNFSCDDLTFLYQAPYGMFSASVGQSIPNNSRTTVSLAIINNSNYGVSGSGGTVTLGPAGMYWITGTATMSAASGVSTSLFRASISYNGTIVGSGSSTTTNYDASPASTATVLYTAATANVSPIQLQAYQNTGGVVTLSTSAVDNYMHVAFVGGA